MNIKDKPYDRTFSFLVIKVANTCNFACPYCFMFQGVDYSYLNKPKIMSKEVAQGIAARVEEYFEENPGAGTLNMVLHGGEPLLLGKKRMRDILEIFSGLKEKYPVDLALQTNGSLIDEEFCELFREFQVKVSMSLDGPPEIQNKTQTRNGSDTYPLIINGLKLLQDKLGDEYFRGLLSVVDVNTDPLEIYNHFLYLGIKRINFLLPLRNHKHQFDYDPNTKKYFQWLKPIFDQYIEDDDDSIEIHVFDSIIDILLGGEMPMCSIRHSAIDMCTIDSNGGIELIDDLKICGDNFTDLGINVSINKLQDFFSTPKVLELREEEINLPGECRDCKYFDICGSGGHSFRYTSEGKFNKPSIYCQDTYALIEHIENTIFEEEEEDDRKDYERRKQEYHKMYFQDQDKRSIYWTNGFEECPVDIYGLFLCFIEHSGNILDLGCGNGLCLKFIKENSELNLEPYGIDFQPAAIEEAREKIFPDRPENFWLGNTVDVEFENNFFDYILLDPYHIHEKERKDVISRVLCKMKKGGSLILYSYHDSMCALRHRRIKDFVGMENFDLYKEDVVLPFQVSMNVLKV